jgi:hypothetical protein
MFGPTMWTWQSQAPEEGRLFIDPMTPQTAARILDQALRLSAPTGASKRLNRLKRQKRLADASRRFELFFRFVEMRFVREGRLVCRFNDGGA